MSQTRHLLFQQLYDLTEKITNQTQAISENMKKNDQELFDTLNEWIDQRGNVIEQLNAIIQDQPAGWATTDVKQIAQMKEWEKSFQPRLQQLYQSFSNQIDKLRQGKQVTRHYHKGYSMSYTDGAYIDKRK